MTDTNRPPTRRRVLGMSLSALAAGMITGRSSLARIDPIERTGPSRLRSSLAAYSFRQALGGPEPTMTLFEFVDRAAAMGLDAVEPTSYYFPDPPDANYLAKLRRHAFLRGLDISGTAIRNDFCQAEGPGREKDLQHTREWIDRAVLLGAPAIRIFAGSTPRGDEESAAVARAIAGIRASLEYAEPRGVVLALENHGGVTTTAEQLLTIVRAIDSPSFGVNLDTGNFKGDDPYAEIAALAPYAVTVQVKTEINPGGKGKEPANLARIVSILREAKYSGYVALEYEAEEDPFVAIPRHVAELRGLLRDE